MRHRIAGRKLGRTTSHRLHLLGNQATDLGNVFLQLGTTSERLEHGQEVFRSGSRIEPRIR